MGVGEHGVGKIVEEVMRVVWAGGRFRMGLHTENRVAAMTEAFDCFVVEIQVSDFDCGIGQ